MGAAIHLPVFQRFDCQSCGHCCREPVVNVTAAERERIAAAGWAAKLGVEPFIKYRYRRRTFWRLAKKPDGACVFLDEQNRCRLHTEHGAAFKPLTCRLYPYVAVPGADAVHIDLRMDCPSVAANTGRTLHIHHAEIAALAHETGVDKPMVRVVGWPGGRELTPAEFRAVVGAFEGVLQRTGEPIRQRLRAGCFLLDFLYAAQVEKVRDQRFLELMSLLDPAAAEEARSRPGADPLSERAARLFRQWLFLHGLGDEAAALDSGFIARLRRSWFRGGQARRFAAGTGPVPALADDWPATTFEAVAAVESGPDEDLEPLVRSLRLKLDAHSFAGPGYYSYDLLSGLTALWLMPALVGWYARLEAVAKNRQAITATDLVAGLRRTHVTFGVSPVFRRSSEVLRMRALAREGIPAAILAAYGP